MNSTTTWNRPDWVDALVHDLAMRWDEKEMRSAYEAHGVHYDSAEKEQGDQK